MDVEVDPGPDRGVAGARSPGHRHGDASIAAERGYSLQANAKTTEGHQHVDRDAQFAYLNEQATVHLAAGDAVISVDTKKKELVGAYKNNGREWHPKGEPEQVKVHDFIDKQLGKANPYGVYDVGANTGWVSVGTDHDTAAFAVNTIRTWWRDAGMICTQRNSTADQRRWRRLQRVSHPAVEDRVGGTGRRHRADDHRVPPAAGHQQVEQDRAPPVLHISMNWRGRPLTSHEVIVETIAATTTSTGLTVHAELDQATYPTGVKIPDTQMKALEAEGVLARHNFHGEWNYTLHPKPRHAEAR